MKRIFAILLSLTTFFLLLTTNSHAQYGQPPPSYSVLIDKMVGKPSQDKGATSYEYVDNLSPSDPRFSPSQEVWFKVKVKNTSEINITAVEVKDYVPTYLEPLEGPGIWNGDTRIITWNAGDFNINEEKIYYLKMIVAAQNSLPADKGLFCVVNKVDARNNIVYDDDSSQLCIEKQVMAVQKVPSAGPEFGLILLSGEIVILAGGLIIKQKLARLDN